MLPVYSITNRRDIGKSFSQQHEALRVTNFTNLRYMIFDGRGEAPAATFIYRKAPPSQEKATIIHYGPFAINQVLSKPWDEDRRKESLGTDHQRE